MISNIENQQAIGLGPSKNNTTIAQQQALQISDPTSYRAKRGMMESGSEEPDSGAKKRKKGRTHVSSEGGGLYDRFVLFKGEERHVSKGQMEA